LASVDWHDLRVGNDMLFYSTVHQPGGVARQWADLAWVVQQSDPCQVPQNYFQSLKVLIGQSLFAIVVHMHLDRLQGIQATRNP